jgi:4-hydroxy-2-oxoheptanedioate aldolase
MNNYAKLKEKFAERKPIKGTTITFFNEPMLVEKMRRDDLDFLLFDMEHGRFDTQLLIPHLHMCRLFGIPSIVRVQDAEYHLIAKTIDMGADGIMLPRTETPAQLKTAVDSMRFHPIGKKGNGGGGQFRANETFEEFQDGGRLLLPQIESPKGVENLPEMLRQYGSQIAGVVIGPSDLSIMAGTPFNTGSGTVSALIQQVYDTCQSHGKSVGIYCGGAADALAHQKRGANIFWTGIDICFLLDGYNKLFDELSVLS